MTEGEMNSRLSSAFDFGRPLTLRKVASITIESGSLGVVIDELPIVNCDRLEDKLSFLSVR